ncbi:MAG: nucleotide exchange factor GrpE, partial [Alphaproteobacteria bacterium]|nr:nucleotide exchange factor GrpE [Alphaproteobacteria bacterium]
NVRRRAEKDVKEASRYSVSKFAQDMVSVADNLGRALDSLDEELKSDERLKGFLEGVELTGRELAASLERHGIKEVHPEGEKFDHNLHEAMFEVEDAEKPHGTVAHVLETGYTIHDRLLRPAKVGVTKKPS